MKCKYCGCTDEKPCVGGCAWAFPNVCTNCVLVPHNIKKAIECYLDDPDVKNVELIITNEDKSKTGFKITK